MSAPPLFTPPEVPEHLLSDFGTSSSAEPSQAFPFNENNDKSNYLKNTYSYTEAN